jgi:hypothetical protein
LAFQVSNPIRKTFSLWIRLGEFDEAEVCFETDQGGDMDFLQQLLRGIAFVPALVNGIEAMFGSKSGEQKKDAAMSFLQAALEVTDAVANRQIIEPEKFKEGISRIVDGTVQCLNASTWTKGGSRPPATSPLP